MTRMLLASFALTVSMTMAASAYDDTWTGTTSDQWNDAANWTNGIPTATGDGYTTINAVVSPAKEPNIPVGQTGRAAGFNLNNGARLYIYGTLTTGSSNVVYTNVNAGGVMEIYGTLDLTKSLYIGPNAGTATVNVRPGGRITPHSGTTLTLGQGAAANIGQLNIWGTANFPNVRWGYNGGTGRMKLYDSGSFTATGDLRTLMQTNIDSGAITSGTPAHVPAIVYLDPNNGNSTTVQLVRTPKATAPTYTPALLTGNTAPLYAASGIMDLSWVKPLPQDPARPVTSSVYFGTGSTLSPVATGTTANSVAVTIEKINQYSWRVDSYDPNTGITTTGDTWTFNTNNIAPTVTAEASPIWTWLAAGSLTLHAVATDDGYPSAVTYTWTQTDATKDVLPSAVTGPDVTLTFPNALTYNFQVVASDGSATSAAYPVQVRVFSTPCAAAKDKSPAAVQPGDFDKDCMVSMVDLAVLINYWLSCTTADGICPY